MARFVLQRPDPRSRRQEGQKRQFENLNASELFCPKCGRSMPVRERHSFALPEGDKYEYLCARCGASVGDKIVKGEPKRIIRDQQPILGWTGLHSWIFLAIVFLGALIMAFQNRYHYVDPQGLGKAYRIDKMFDEIQEYDPAQGWTKAQFQPLPSPQALSMADSEGSQVAPMQMPGSLPPSPPALALTFR
jgi:hypothetical protein